MQIFPDGYVVESGYTNLMRAPLTQSWVAPATVSATKNPNTVEANETGAACIGLVFLTDTPKSPAVHLYDYVLIQGYPAGSYSYVSVPPINRTVRRFSAGLETAVRLTAQAKKSD